MIKYKSESDFESRTNFFKAKNVFYKFSEKVYFLLFPLPGNFQLMQIERLNYYSTRKYFWCIKIRNTVFCLPINMLVFLILSLLTSLSYRFCTFICDFFSVLLSVYIFALSTIAIAMAVAIFKLKDDSDK